MTDYVYTLPYSYGTQLVRDAWGWLLEVCMGARVENKAALHRFISFVQQLLLETIPMCESRCCLQLLNPYVQLPGHVSSCLPCAGQEVESCCGDR